MDSIFYTAIFAALHALLFLALSCYVSYLRLSHKVSLGDHGDRLLMRVMRAHGNLAEHLPLALLLLLISELQGTSAILLLLAGLTLFIGRLAHAWGMLSKATTVRRQVGAGLTYLVQLVLALNVLIQLAI